MKSWRKQKVHPASSEEAGMVPGLNQVKREIDEGKGRTNGAMQNVLKGFMSDPVSEEKLTCKQTSAQCRSGKGILRIILGS